MAKEYTYRCTSYACRYVEHYGYHQGTTIECPKCGKTMRRVD